MADPRGFLRVHRKEAPKRPVAQRVRDWQEVGDDRPGERTAGEVADQATRCMDCGIPFCHSGTAGCPLGNLIPEWNDLVRRGRWAAASERLHATNNFPEVTGRICPAPCETACVLSLAEQDTGGSVAIKWIERAVADAARAAGALTPRRAVTGSGRAVAVVGSGPAGLAAAQQLTRAGHEVTVFERDDRLGGLLRYGIPSFKLDKTMIDRRVDQMRAEGTAFVTGCEVGVDPTVMQLRERFDAVVLALGALLAHDDTTVPGRRLAGVHLAMEHLVLANRECEGDGVSPVTAHDRHVVIIGGGDTGADCLGTAHRQGALSVTQLDYHPRAPLARDEERSPWPAWPIVLRTSPAHAEGGVRRYEVAVQRFLGDPSGRVRAIALSEVRATRDGAGRRRLEPTGDCVELPCDLALLALGFDGVEREVLLDGLGLAPSAGGVLTCGTDWQTRAPGVFVCGDAHRGASLVVWAIAEGRSVAHAVDVFLTGHSDLPAPVRPTALPLEVL